MTSQPPTPTAAINEAWWDRLLDRSLLGYTRLGPALRQRHWPPDPRPGALAGRVALVTGANRGLGRATAAGLARLDARVHLVVRDPAAGRQTRTGLLADQPDARIDVDVCDLSSLASVRDYTASITGPIHVLIHNAGVLPPSRQTSVDGHERGLATHVLGPHLLTALLAPNLIADPPGRVIWMCSGGMYAHRLRLDDPQYQCGRYRGAIAYGRTKRMQATLAQLWSDRLAGTGVTVHAAHPGWAATGGVHDALPHFSALTHPLLRSAEQGADTPVWLAATDHPGQGSGRLWHDRAPRPYHYLPRTRDSPSQRAQLWQLCQDLTRAPDHCPDKSGRRG